MLPASVVRLAHISCFDLEACWLIRGLCEGGQPAADNDVSFPQSLDSRTAGERASHPERATKKMFQRFEWCAPCPVVGVASDCGFVENVASVVLLPLHDSTQPVSRNRQLSIFLILSVQKCILEKLRQDREPMRKPRIAIILDENTTTGGTRYETAKGYFRGVGKAGGLPFGIPYLPEVVDIVVNEFDGLVSVGGRFAYPDDWYISGEISKAPQSERLEVERAIVEGFLERDKPILGICAGMQMLACLNGCRLTPDLRAFYPTANEHDKRDHLHAVEIAPESRLAKIIGKTRIEVNTFHREAIAQLSPAVLASAYADDGIVEAIEVISNSFAIGLQWHQELFVDAYHPGNALFHGLVDAAS